MDYFHGFFFFFFFFIYLFHTLHRTNPKVLRSDLLKDRLSKVHALRSTGENSDKWRCYEWNLVEYRRSKRAKMQIWGQMRLLHSNNLQSTTYNHASPLYVVSGISRQNGCLSFSLSRGQPIHIFFSWSHCLYSYLEFSH